MRQTVSSITKIDRRLFCQVHYLIKNHSRTVISRLTLPPQWSQPPRLSTGYRNMNPVRPTLAGEHPSFDVAGHLSVSIHCYCIRTQVAQTNSSELPQSPELPFFPGFSDQCNGESLLKYVPLIFSNNPSPGGWRLLPDSEQSDASKPDLQGTSDTPY